MKSETTIFYDVDTQRDFLVLGGSFRIAGAEKVVPVLKAITEFAREQSVRIVCSVDRHVPGDPVLKSWGGALPDHCLAETPGEKKIDETAPLNPLVLENKEYSSYELRDVLGHTGEIVFQRQQFDALANNSHARAMLRLVLQPYTDIVVYGVFTELCVDREINALVGLGPKIHIVKDAISIAGAEPPKFFGLWEAQGVELIAFEKVKVRMLNS
jgi:nicotinamidase-related amidase